MTVMCVGNSEIVDIAVINRICCAPKLHTYYTYRHAANCVRRRYEIRKELGSLGRWRVLTCCWWRNEAPVLIKSGAWSDKAETEMQRREEARQKRARGRWRVRVSVSPPQVFCRVHGYCTVVPGGGQSSVWKG